MSKLAWHYTTGENFIKIVECGELTQTIIRMNNDQSPVLWFSQNPIWEPTACKGLMDIQGNIRTATRHETRKHGGGLVRFGFPRSRLLPWEELRAAANIRKKSRIALESVGKDMIANPKHWMGVLEPIAVPSLTVDVLDGEWSWVNVQ